MFRRVQYWVYFFFLFELKFSAEPFADDTSLFLDKNRSANILNNNLLIISKCAYNWKMFFNQDPIRPAEEMLFSRKKKSSNSSNHKSQQYSG